MQDESQYRLHWRSRSRRCASRMIAGQVLRVVEDIIAGCGLERPDGRPLHAYDIEPASFSRLRNLLPLRIVAGERQRSTAMGFAIWAAEHLRANYSGGHLTWEFVFGGLGLPRPDYPFITWLAETGLAAWRRQVRVGENARARMRRHIMRILNRHAYPPGLMVQAVQMVTIAGRGLGAGGGLSLPGDADLALRAAPSRAACPSDATHLCVWAAAPCAA